MAEVVVMASAAVAAIARVTHEANRAWCALNGDGSQAEWDDAPDWQRASAIAGVEFHLANPDATDAASHENWMAQKVAEGWKYGPLKDADAKVHPCLVPFIELPPEQQFKDRLFRTIVHAAATGLAPVLEEAAEARARADQNAAAADAAHRENETLKAKVKVERKPRVAKPRKAGPMEASVGRDELGELLASDEVEIVFSNGKSEIAGIDPVSVRGADAWAPRRGGWMLREHLLVHGPAIGSAPHDVRGFGLFDAGGKQIAWCELPAPSVVQAGAKVAFRDTIIF